jgi:hypothetical protein
VGLDEVTSGKSVSTDEFLEDFQSFSKPREWKKGTQEWNVLEGASSKAGRNACELLLSGILKMRC